MSKLEAVAKIVAWLAMAGYLLWLFLRRRERKVPPCETCKHLLRVDGRGVNKRWHCGHKYTFLSKFSNDLDFCSRYSPREEEGGARDE